MSGKVKFFNQILWLVFLLVLIFSSVVVYSEPAVFLNRAPGTHFLVSLDNDSFQQLPVFFLFDELKNGNVEFFVIRQFRDSGKKQFLQLEGNQFSWKEYQYNNEVRPLLAGTIVVQYLLLDKYWFPVDIDSDDNFDVTICIDGDVDASFPGANVQNERFACGTTLVIFDFVLSPPSITLSRSGEVASRVQVQDKNGNSLSFQAVPKEEWIVVEPQEGEGSFTVSLNLEQLPPDESTGQINVISEGHTKTVTVKVPAANLINPSDVVVEPQSFELPRDADIIQQVKVEDSAGNPLDFTLSTSVDWLKILQKQKGSFSIKLEYSYLRNMNTEISGSITVWVGPIQKEITVTVPAATLPQPSHVIVTPDNLSLPRFSLIPKPVRVEDSAGNPLDFTLHTSVEWLILSTEGQDPLTGSGSLAGKGFFKINLDSTNLPPRAATGIIEVTVGSITKNVTVNVSAPPTNNISLWESELFFSLPAGKEEIKSVSVECGGGSASSCTVTTSNRPSWLHFDNHCSSGKFNVTVNTNGLSAGFTKKINLTVAANCGSKILPVTLTVQGECEATRLIVSPTLLNIEADQGANPPEQTVSIKDDCGRKLDFEVKEISGEWITFPRSGDTGTGQLKIKFNAAFLESKEDPYKGSIKLSTSLGEIRIPINLTINPPCELENARFEYNDSDDTTKVTVSVMQGSNPSNLTVIVTDKCGNQLNYDIKEVTPSSSWLTASNAGQGKLVISFASSSLDVGRHEGTITIIPKKPNGEETYPELTLTVELKVNANSSPVNVQATPLIMSDAYKNFTFPANKTRLFKLRADTLNRKLSIAVEVPSHYEDGKLYVMVKYAGENFEIPPPNEEDYNKILDIIARDLWQFKGVYEAADYLVYYYFSRQITKRILYISNPAVANGGWWIWVKNIGDQTLTNCAVFFEN